MWFFRKIRLKRQAEREKFNCINKEDFNAGELKILKELSKGDKEKIKIIGKR